ncbi:MAG: hypothetical protein M1829_000678 [Trizodia sp. TS-e1964]|nr:MAG: hypothetical protein M1829_000678 [Trizodia sp. TS-e1964]
MFVDHMPVLTPGGDARSVLSHINQLVNEKVVDTPTRNDYLALVREAATNHSSSFSKLSQELEAARTDAPPSKPLKDYTGKYQDPN